MIFPTTQEIDLSFSSAIFSSSAFVSFATRTLRNSLFFESFSGIGILCHTLLLDSKDALGISCVTLMKQAIKITKYKGSRFWAIWLEEELLAVVCYKKGALAIKEALEKSIRIEP